MKMFRCRACSGTPFAAFFGLVDSEEENEKKKAEKETSDTEDGISTPEHLDDLSNNENDNPDEPRNAEEISYLVKIWDSYVHERVKHLWKNSKTRKEVLKCIAIGCSKKDDPVLGNDLTCVRWIGKFEDGYPVMFIPRPGETEENSTFVTRMMVFLFADQESYEKTDSNKYSAFTMACGNKWCVNLTHIML